MEKNEVEHEKVWWFKLERFFFILTAYNKKQQFHAMLRERDKTSPG